MRWRELRLRDRAAATAARKQRTDPDVPRILTCPIRRGNEKSASDVGAGIAAGNGKQWGPWAESNCRPTV